MRVFLRKVMLSNNRHNSNSCAFGEQIVSYLYNEAGALDKNEFETHLSDCAACADELSGFGFVRSSISEWRKEEIFALELPALEIPSMKTTKVVETSTIAAESGSWLADLRGLFSLSPKLAFGSAAFAFAIVCVGLSLVILNYSGNETIAENGNQNSGKILASNKTDKGIEANPLKPQDEKNSIEKDSPQKFVALDNQSDEKLPTVKKDSAVKVTNSAPKNKLAAPKLNNIEASANNLYKKNKTDNTRKQEVPKLSDFDEDEDESLRLTDLFAEIDTK